MKLLRSRIFFYPDEIERIEAQRTTMKIPQKKPYDHIIVAYEYISFVCVCDCDLHENFYNE